MQSSSRNGARVIWLAVHTTEGIMRAADLRAWSSWPGSSHASNDETGVLLSGADDGFVDYDRAAWTLRNGNPFSDNLEQCGWARWTREEWLARPKLLDTTAKWLADRHKARPWIPLVHLSLEEIRAGKPGVIGHADYTFATGDGSHTDPGKSYPWDVVIDKARAYAEGIHIEPEDDMTDEQARQLAEVLANAKATNGAVAAINVAVRDPRGGLLTKVAALAGQVSALTEAVSQLSGGSGLDAGTIAAAAERGAEKALADLGDALKAADDA